MNQTDSNDRAGPSDSPLVSHERHPDRCLLVFYNSYGAADCGGQSCEPTTVKTDETQPVPTPNPRKQAAVLPTVSSILTEDVERTGVARRTVSKWYRHDAGFGEGRHRTLFVVSEIVPWEAREDL